jgi:hypothetical protein
MTPRLIINSSSITIELVRVVRISKRRVIISQHSTKQMFFLTHMKCLRQLFNRRVVLMFQRTERIPCPTGIRTPDSSFQSLVVIHAELDF